MKLEREDIRRQVETAFEISCVMNAGLKLYGVFEKELFADIYEKVVMEGRDDNPLDVESDLEEMLDIFEEENLICRNENRIVSCEIDSESSTMRLLKCSLERIITFRMKTRLQFVFLIRGLIKRKNMMRSFPVCSGRSRIRNRRRKCWKKLSGL